MRIIKSNTAHGAYMGVVHELKMHIGADEENIVIAPDRFTAFVERALISTLKLKSTFGIEVVSFTRLANKLVGRDIKKCLTPEGAVMLISNAILAVKDKLAFYKNAVGKDGFASEMYAALTALRNSDATVDSLRESAEKLEEKSQLRAKILDVALIYEEYLRQLEVSHSDSTTRLMALANFIEQHPEAVSGKNFYCTDIYEFSSPELAILHSIDKHANSLTIGVPSGFDNPNKRIYPDRVIEKLKSISSGAAEIVQNDEKLIPPIDAISKSLFSYFKPKSVAENRDENGNQKVFLRVAKDRYDEILKLATDIASYVREQPNDGTKRRYKDIEVFVSDLPAYQADIKAVFLRYGIPFFIDEKELLSEQTKVRYLLSALAVIKSGFRSAEVLDFVKNPLFFNTLKNEGGEEEVFLFENYVLKHSIEKNSFLCEFKPPKKQIGAHRTPKNEFNFEGVSEGTRVLIDSEENVIPEKVRRALISVLAPINFKKDTPLADIVGGCKELLKNVDADWRKHVEQLTQVSEYYRKCAEQVDEKINSVFDEIIDVLHGEYSMKDFAVIVESMIKTLKIALVPTYLDCVFVGSYDSRFMGGKDIYILGAVSGKLPAAMSGGVVLSANDEETLEQVGVKVSPTSYQKIMTGMYAVCDIMKKPHGKLIISRPEMADGVFLQPSVVISELKGILSIDGKPLEEEQIDFEHLSKIPDGEGEKLATLMFSTDESAYHEILRSAMPLVLKDAASNRIVPEELPFYSAAYETLNENQKHTLESMETSGADKNIVSKRSITSTSVSHLEAFYTCPYQHYFKYTLALKKRQEGEFLGTESGTILHSVLEQLFKDIKAGNETGTVVVDKNNVAEKAKVYFDNAIAENDFEYLFEQPKTRRALDRLKRESITLSGDMLELSKHSEFKPYLLETKIGQNGINPMTIEVGGHTIDFKGVIDRIDTLDDKFLIIDYKTGNKELKFREIYYGQMIQLYIYMEAVKASLGKRPVGVAYFPILSGFSKDDEQRYKYEGNFVNDGSVLQAIDDRFEASFATSIFPTTDVGNPKQDSLISSEMLDLIGEYALAVAKKGAEAIEKGFIKPLPTKNKCGYCDFKDSCAYCSLSERKLQKVSQVSFKKEEAEGNKNE